MRDETPGTPDRTEERVKPPTLSRDIDDLLAALKESPTTLREIMTVVRGRAYTFLLIILSLPFCSPVPLPGLSTLFGSVIALIGLRLSFRQQPWLPARILDRPIASAKVGMLLRGIRRLASTLEFFLRPRWTVLVDFLLLHHFYGFMIFISGLLLLLPLPIPFSNLLPGLTVIFLAGALMERDGYSIVAGVLTFLLTLAFFIAIFVGGVAVVDWLEAWFGGVFDPQEMPPPDLPLPTPTNETQPL
jgi:hypothetical protein